MEILCFNSTIYITDVRCTVHFIYTYAANICIDSFYMTRHRLCKQALILFINSA